MSKRDPETRYQRLIEHMNEGVWMGDARERTIYANPKFCQMMEYTLEEMLGRESYEFWDPESAARVRRVNTTDRKQGESSSYEGNLLTKSGKRIPVLLSGTPLPDGGTIGIMTDLTDLKLTQAKEHLLNRAVEFANDAIIIVGISGTIESWNKGARLLFGYKKDEIVGKPLRWIFPPESVDAILSRSGVHYTFESKGATKGKQAVNVSVTLTPVTDAGSRKATSWLLILRDITMQAKFEEELSLKYQKIRDAYNQFGIVRRQMDYVFELTHLCAGHPPLKHLADFVVNSVIMLTKVDACILRLYNPAKKTLDVLSSFGLTEEWKGKASIKYARSVAEKAFRNGSPLKIIDISKEPRYQSAHLARKNNLSSMLMVPLVFKSEIVGSLSLYASPQRKLEIFENEFIAEYAALVTVAVASYRD